MGHYCKNCKRKFHPLGIARHRAMHRDKKEDCVIVNQEKGIATLWEYSKIK